MQYPPCICYSAPMEIIAVVIWLALAVALYVGLRARMHPHQPAWQALVIVAVIVAFVAGGGYVVSLLAQRPNYGVEDGGGRPEHPGQL